MGHLNFLGNKGMWFYISLSLVCFLLSIVIAAIAFAESKRDDIVIIDDVIDRERVKRLLSLPEESRRRLDREVKAELDSRNYD